MFDLDLTHEQVVEKFLKFRGLSNSIFLHYYPDFDVDFYKQKYLLDGSDRDIMKNFWLIGQYKSRRYKNKYTIVFYINKINDAVGGANILLHAIKTINQLNHPKIDAKIYVANGLDIANRFVRRNDYCTPYEFNNDHTIAVYPENVIGNPLNAKNVIRWIFLPVDIDDQSESVKKWNKKDRIYSWEPDLNHNRLVLPMSPIIMFPNIYDYTINNDTRKGKSVYLVKKGRFFVPNFDHYKVHDTFHKDLNKHPSDSICLDYFDSQKPEQMIEMFHNSEFFYCYDPNSFWAVIAPLCGCITILCIPEQQKKQKRFKNRKNYFQQSMLYHKSGHLHDAGIAFGDSNKEIEYARATLPKAKESIDKLIKLYEQDFFQWLDEDVVKYLDNINQ